MIDPFVVRRITRHVQSGHVTSWRAELVAVLIIMTLLGLVVWAIAYLG